MSNFDASTPQLKAAQNVMGVFAALEVDNLMALLSKNYQYEVFGGATSPTKMNREVYAEVIRGLSAGVTKMDLNYHEVIEAPGKVILHFSALCNTPSGATLPYDVVGILSVEEEDGELKVTSIKSFPDIQQHDAIIALATKAAAERGSAL